MSVKIDKTVFSKSSNGAAYFAAGRQLYVLARNGSLNRTIDPADIEATETLVEGFSDEALTVSLGTGPFTSDADGHFNVFVTLDNYDLYAPADPNPLTRWQPAGGGVPAEVATLSAAVTALDARSDSLESDSAATTPYVAVMKEAPLNVEWPEYGADPARTAAQNAVSLQAAIDALPVTGGRIIAPRAYSFDTPLDAADRRGVSIEGVSGLSAGANSQSVLVYTGTTDRPIDARSTDGFWLRDLQLLYTHASFTGHVVDFTPSASGTDSSAGGIERCFVGGAGGVNGSYALIRANKTQALKLTDTILAGAQRGVRGIENIAHYAVSTGFDNVTFKDMVVCNVVDPHQGWVFNKCTHQQLTSGNAGAIASNYPVYGLTILGGWMGDANALGNWVAVYGYGIYVLGTTIGAGLVGVRTDLGDSYGVRVRAQFEFCQYGYIADTGGGYVADDIDTSGSTFTGIAAAKRVVMGTAQTAAPVAASGPHHVGERRYKSNPAAGGKIGWVCVTAGTPGTWKAFGAIDA